MTTVVQACSAEPVCAAALLGHAVQRFATAFGFSADGLRLHIRAYRWNCNHGGAHGPGFSSYIRSSIDMHDGYALKEPRRPATVWNPRGEFPLGPGCNRSEFGPSFGWATPAAPPLGIVHAATTGTPLLYFGDTNPRSPAKSHYRRLRGLLLRVMLRIAAGAVATGAFNRRFYFAHRMAHARVHPGVCPADVARFAVAQRAPRRVDEARPIVVGFAGNFTAVKGVADLVASAARLSRDEAWELRLIGDGPLGLEIEALVGEHGLRDRVRFLGFRIDIMVTPSRVEPRGLVAIEAMAAGAAVIVSSATGVWGPGDAVEHERSGLVYPVGDIDALAQCLHGLMRDGALRARLTRDAQARVADLGPDGFAATAAAALLTVATRR
jgi:glycosyltransferase involved in cell wall biosynthesis